MAAECFLEAEVHSKVHSSDNRALSEYLCSDPADRRDKWAS